MQSFLLVILDHDNKAFSIEGPMEDDKPLTDALIAAQDRGRSVTFLKPAHQATRELLIEQMKLEFGYKQSKSILNYDV